MSGSGQRVRKGEKEETRRAEEERDPCGGGQDGWTARSHAKERKEGGREENWMEVKEIKMRTRNELGVGGDSGGWGVSSETALIFFMACELIHSHYLTCTH